MNDTITSDTIAVIDSVFVEVDTSFTQVSDTCVAMVAQQPQAISEPGLWAPIWIPTVCSIAVFVLGWVFTRLFKWIDDCKARSNYRSMLVDWVDMVVPVEETFVESIKALSKAIADSDNMQPEPYAMPQSIPNRLNELSLEQLTDAFLRGAKNDKPKRNAHLFNIVSGFEFLAKISRQVATTYEAYNKQAFDLCREWNEVYQSFVNQVKTSSHAVEYQQLLRSWQLELIIQRDSTTVHQKHISEFYTHANTLNDNDMLPLINRMRYIIQLSQALRKGMAKNFANMALVTKSSLKTMAEAAEHFSK